MSISSSMSKAMVLNWKRVRGEWSGRSTDGIVQLVRRCGEESFSIHWHVPPGECPWVGPGHTGGTVSRLASKPFGNPPKEPEKVSGEKEVWASCQGFCPRKLVLDKRKMMSTTTPHSHYRGSAADCIGEAVHLNLNVFQTHWQRYFVPLDQCYASVSPQPSASIFFLLVSTVPGNPSYFPLYQSGDPVFTVAFPSRMRPFPVTSCTLPGLKMKRRDQTSFVQENFTDPPVIAEDIKVKAKT
ncbi:hypothetical protein CHARACLAT_013797, partial [Characodon lateralis]|nr:hypothetical protein [Characodon lateralis]